MAQADTEVENQDTTEDEGTEQEDSSSMSKRDKQKRAQELRSELADLEKDGPLEDSDDDIAADVAEDVEDAAEDIASGSADTEQEIESEATNAAESIAEGISKQHRITLSDEEVKGIASRIVREIKSQMGPATESKPARERTPDRRPASTHWTEKKLFGGRK